MRKSLELFGSYITMGAIMIVLAFVVAFATVIEKEFGSDASWGLVYGSWWFNLLWLLLSLNLLVALFTRARFSRARVGVFLFHLSFLVIIVGAAVTRFTGTAGVLHLREGVPVNRYISEESYLQLADSAGNVFFERQLTLGKYSNNRFKHRLKTPGGPLSLNLVRFIPHAAPILVHDANGKTVVKLIIATQSARYSRYIAAGEVTQVDGVTVGFGSTTPTSVALTPSDSGITIQSLGGLAMGGMEQPSVPISASSQPLLVKPGKLYSGKGWQLVMVEVDSFSRVEYASQHGSSDMAFTFIVEQNGHASTVNLLKSIDDEGWSTVDIGLHQYRLRYGSKAEKLPFKMVLNKFMLDRYPGSQSPSAYTSLVTVIDSSANQKTDYTITMSRVLDLHGYRFFQSSYDEDEHGSVLRVSDDFWGMTITYMGYGLFMVGVLLTLVTRRSKLYALLSKRTAMLLFMLLAAVPISISAQPLPTPPVEQARAFGRLLTLSHDGRIHPLNTLSGEVVRKLTGGDTFHGMTSDQLLLGMSAFPDFWQSALIIRVENPQMRAILGMHGEMASFLNFFDSSSGGYLLKNPVSVINRKPPAERTKTDRDVLKVDERVSICYMIFTGNLLKIFPYNSGTDWRSIASVMASGGDTTMPGRLLANYFTQLRTAMATNKFAGADSALVRFAQYQKKAALISFDGSAELELLYNRLDLFNRIVPFYGLAGLALLMLLFFRKRWAEVAGKFFVWMVLITFVFHTVGMVLRWIVAGHAPMSNGYESMLMISWVAVGGGLLAVRRLPAALGVAALLATATLFVAHLSWMDPEITNLVPVLKSKWLTLHVSFVMAGYAFFGIGALLGILSLLIIAIPRLYKKVIGADFDNIQKLMESAMVVGLYLFTVGTLLGAIWANESWGRYWGWDPKESWALVTILVYVVITHLNNVPGFKNPVALSFSSVVGFMAVLMTYFGVNYLLTGLHSYAAGETTHIPVGIYAGVVAVMVLWLVALLMAPKTIGSKKQD